MAYENIKKMLDDAGKSQADLARYLNKTPATVTNLLDGTKQLKVEEAHKIAQFLGKDVTAVINTVRTLVPVLGHVGGGQEIEAVDPYAIGAAIDEVEPPTGYYADDIACVAVRGNSMEPMIENNWLIFYRKEHDGVPPDCIGSLCVVKLANDGMLVKKVRNGSASGLYHLLSKNPEYETIFDQRLQWASRVIDIRPR